MDIKQRLIFPMPDKLDVIHTCQANKAWQEKTENYLHLLSPQWIIRKIQASLIH